MAQGPVRADIVPVAPDPHRQKSLLLVVLPSTLGAWPAALLNAPASCEGQAALAAEKGAGFPADGHG